MAIMIKMVRCLVLLNLSNYILLAVIGCMLTNDAIDIGYDMTGGDAGYYYYYSVSRASAIVLTNLFATMAGVVGVAAALPGLRHVWSWSQGSLLAAAYPGFMAWLLTLLALGLAIKEVIILGASVRDYLSLTVMRALLLGGLSVTQPIYLMTILFHTGT